MNYLIIALMILLSLNVRTGNPGQETSSEWKAQPIETETGKSVDLSGNEKRLLNGSGTVNTDQDASPGKDGITAGELWEQYIQNPDDHSHIPNVSYAGYKRSETPFPTSGSRSDEHVIDVRDHGASGNGQTDDTHAFHAAIDQAASQGGGIIHIPSGTYLLTDLLHIYHDDIILQGNGQEETTLLFDSDLTDAIGENRSPAIGSSRWSWTGGMIWIGPDDTFDDEGQLTGSPAWRDRQAITHLVRPAYRGDRTITVDDASSLSAGDFVLLAWQNPDDLSLLLEMAGHSLMSEYDWSTATSLTGRSNWPWPVEIESVEGNQVTLVQPIRIDAREEWDVRIETPGPTVRGSGIERLTIAFTNPRPIERHTRDIIGNNGIYLNRVIDCFVRSVTIRNAENGVILAEGKQTTVFDVRFEGTLMHHATLLRASHDNLISDFVIEAEVMHGINTAWLATGNVWRRGVMKHGTFDSHRGMSWDLVRTDITVNNDGRPGGGLHAGPFHGRRVVHWNIQITNDTPNWINQPEAISMGALVGVRGAPVSENTIGSMASGDKGNIIADPGHEPSPHDLFEAQFYHRTGHDLYLNLE